MRKKIEHWAASVAMAEYGADDLWSGLPHGFSTLAQGPGPKFLLVTDNEEPSEDAVSRTAALSERLSAHVLVLSTAHPAGDALSAAGRLQVFFQAKLAELRCPAVMLAAAMVRARELGSCISGLCGRGRGIRFVVVDGNPPPELGSRLTLPVFRLHQPT